MFDSSSPEARGLSMAQAKAVVRADAAVAIGYVIVGIPFGMIGASLGFEPLQVFMLSFFFLSGAGQAMMQNMLMAGFAMPTVLASVMLVSSRHILYSAAMAPYARGMRFLRRFAFAWNLTDEGFGVNMDRLSSGERWTANQIIAVNTANQVLWGVSTFAGAVLVNFISLPAAMASFGVTCIFVCMLVGQLKGASTFLAAGAAIAGVFAAKLAGLDGIAVILGAIIGVAVGFFAGEKLGHGGDGERLSNGDNPAGSSNRMNEKDDVAPSCATASASLTPSISLCTGEEARDALA